MSKRISPSKVRSKKRRSRRRPVVVPGTAPGSLPPPSAEAQATKVRVMAYGSEGFVEADEAPLSEVLELRRRWAVVWIHVVGLDDTATIQALGETFGIHPLTLEDVVHSHQRPKVEGYDAQLFWVLRAAHLEPELEVEQFSLLLGEGYVISFVERSRGLFNPVRERIRRGRGRIRRCGADYCAYALLDTVIDNYFPVLSSREDVLNKLEDQVFERPHPDVPAQIYTIKRDLNLLRRAVWPLQELFAQLQRDEDPRIQEQTYVYLRDCRDHAFQLLEMIEDSRETANGLMGLYQNKIDQRLNEIMKVLTIMSTIFIPLSFLAGLYGMNFSTDSPYNMPELSSRYGYPVLLSVMVLMAAGMLVFFQRKGWLHRSTPRPPRTED